MQTCLDTDTLTSINGIKRRLQLTCCIQMDSFFWLDTITWDSPLYISRGDRLYFKKNIAFFCMKIFLHLQTV